MEIHPYWFRVELPKVSFMEFIAHTPQELYFLIPEGGMVYYGMLLREDLVEYLINEFRVISFEIVQPAVIKKMALTSRVFGSEELVNF